jgi:non-specific serine/threonine protein kinase
MANPAVALFVQRARASDPAFALTAEQAAAVGEIVRRLDGLPLAIELAAARSNVLTPHALLTRLEPSLALLTGGGCDQSPRHQTMRATIAWGYDQLTADERTLLRRLSVFGGGFSLEAAAWVMATVDGAASSTDSPDLVLDVIASLVDRSMVRSEVAQEESPRFSLLETVREFAAEQLRDANEHDAAGDALAAWCLDLAERSTLPALLPSLDRHLCVLEADNANLRVALEWLDRRGDGERLLRLAAALGWFWHTRGHFGEGRRWLERALQRAQGAATPAHAHALVELGYILSYQGETARAAALMDESVPILREHGDTAALAGVRVWQGWIACQSRDFDRAATALDQALNLAATIPDPVVSTSLTGRILANLGVVAHGRGDLDEARGWHERALRARRACGDVLGTHRSLRDLGDVARDLGDHAASVAAYRESLETPRDGWDMRVVADVLAGVALAAIAWRQPERGARLLGAEEALRDQLGTAIVVPADRAAYDRARTALRAALDEQDLVAAWSAGYDLSIERAVEEAFVVGPTPVAPEIPATGAATGLSPRERDVLALLAAGYTNRAIAEALFIGLPTVKWHVAGILAKLGLGSRTAAALYAHHHGLA